MATSKNKDFDPAELVSASKSHEEQLKGLADRITKLEGQVGTPSAFAATFATAQGKEKQIDESIIAAVDKHDNHKLKVNGIAIVKWAAGIAVGSFLTWLFTQVVIIPQYNQKIETLQNEINKQSSGS